ncbi:PAS domain-containing sensor histidine kinase [Sulfitobacter sp. F26169L]|uniref:PAS domain-containing sensor histidine kinase n=1 Tax=Sulfitobacter sp. F26169L TaxID=2996015 RepID=UPI002260BF8F|nr:PAS domain-containing sensor histidine kinase [Sulfitobacter sp. F26169L]MCX7566484.1 PAS domain-containing sensor histidine kinase [Sulfitobacter sp. F26169L]
MMSSTALAITCGCGVATGWYSLTQLALSGGPAQVIPIFGAIVLAGTVPTVIIKKTVESRFRDFRHSMSQRLDAFDKHACINIVDETGNLTEVNEKLLELTGYDRTDLIGQPVTLLYNDLDSKIAFDIRENLHSGKSWKGETPLRRKDGREIFTESTIMPLFDPAGNWSGSISVRTDISSTNELVAERHTAQTLYELRDDIWIIDSGMETVSYLNRTAENRFNTCRKDYPKRSVSDLDPSGDTAEVLASCRALVADGKTTSRFETVLMGAPVDVSIKFLTGAENSGRYLILISDISERVEQEKQKSAFISTVSHELRSPLTSIKGAMGLLLSNSAGDLPDRAISLLEIAHRNADRLILIINDILDLDKLADGEMDIEIKEVDLSELIREADQASAVLQQRFGVQIELTGTESAFPFNTDPNRFLQVMTNLLSNAYKFSKPGGTIFVDVRDEGELVRVSVTDEGQGIPLDEQHKIFSRFSDMTNSDRALKGGTGLGLNICKAIVENMGGTIGFESAEGKGARFFFCLPKVQSAPSSIKTLDVKRCA